MNIEPIEDNILNFRKHIHTAPALICCWGDTLTHLSSEREVNDLFSHCAEALAPGGLLLLSFRDYSTELKNEERFIPVKSEANRIFTCMLEFSPVFVKVTDLIYDRIEDNWQLKASSYLKLRLEAEDIKDALLEQGFTIKSLDLQAGHINIIAEKSGS